MTPIEKRIVIAKACGWKDVERCTRNLKPDPNGVQVRGYKIHDWEGKEFTFVPDYLNDLNAMYEAEAVLIDTIEKMDDYNCILANIVGLEPKDERLAYFRLIHATANQKADAIIQTLKL